MSAYIIACKGSSRSLPFLLTPPFLLLPGQQGHHPWLAKLRPKGSVGKTFSESSEDTTTCSQDVHCQIPQDCQRSTSSRCFLATGFTTTWSIVGRTKWSTAQLPFYFLQKERFRDVVFFLIKKTNYNLGL